MRTAAREKHSKSLFSQTSSFQIDSTEKLPYISNTIMREFNAEPG
jgi:hypothetical protein